MLLLLLYIMKGTELNTCTKDNEVYQDYPSLKLILYKLLLLLCIEDKSVIHLKEMYNTRYYVTHNGGFFIF